MAIESHKHLERAVHLLSSGAWAEAVTAYEAALALDAELLEAAIGLARVREVEVVDPEGVDRGQDRGDRGACDVPSRANATGGACENRRGATR